MSAHRGLQGVWPCCGKMVSTLSFPAAMCLQGRLCGHTTSWWGHWHCALSEPSLQFSSLNSRISSLCRNILGQACNDSLSTTVGVISLGQWRGRRLLAALLSYDFLRTPDKARPWGGGEEGSDHGAVALPCGGSCFTSPASVHFSSWESWLLLPPASPCVQGERCQEKHYLESETKQEEGGAPSLRTSELSEHRTLLLG